MVLACFISQTLTGPARVYTEANVKYTWVQPQAALLITVLQKHQHFAITDTKTNAFVLKIEPLETNFECQFKTGTSTHITFPRKMHSHLKSK